MFIVSRLKDESLVIGDDVLITIIDVRGDKVRLGVEAPRSISVHRKEVYDAIQREKEAKRREQSEIEAAIAANNGKEEHVFYIAEELENDIFDDNDGEDIVEEMKQKLEKDKEQMKDIPDLPV